jgi:hypothetical protein
MVFARRAAARRREEEKRKEEEAEALEEDGGDNVFVWAGKAVGGWVGGIFGGGRGKEEADNEVERMRAPSLLMEEKEVAESIAAGEGEAGKEGGAWGVFSFFFPPSPSASPPALSDPASGKGAEGMEGRDGEGKAPAPAVSSSPSTSTRDVPRLSPREMAFDGREQVDQGKGQGGRSGLDKERVLKDEERGVGVAQCPPDPSDLPSRPPFLPPQDWYLARASEKMAPVSPTSPPIPSYWEDKAGEEGEEGTSFASAGAWWEDRKGEERGGRLAIVGGSGGGWEGRKAHHRNAVSAFFTHL